MSVHNFMNVNVDANSHLQGCAPAVLRPVRVVGFSTQ